jgi:HSP20 family protein
MHKAGLARSLHLLWLEGNPFQGGYEMNSLTTYNPTSLFDRALDGFFDDSFWGRGRSHHPVDIREEDTAYVVEAELPGLTEKDLQVKVENDMLTIASSNQTEREEKKGSYLLRERHSRSFRRSFVLPADVDREKIEARFENGLLVLSLPKSETAKPKQIEVKKA